MQWLSACWIFRITSYGNQTISSTRPSCWILISAAWRSGNGVGRINEVTLRRARLVLGWVTCPGSTPGGGNLFRYVTSQPRPTQPFILSGSINFIGECSRDYRLSYGVVYVILGLAVLVEHRLVTDGQTHDDSIYRASIASRGKKHKASRVHGVLAIRDMQVSTKLLFVEPG